MGENGLNDEYHPAANPGVLELLQYHQAGTLKQFRPGSILFRQGETSKRVYAIQKGAVKMVSLSAGGREHTFTILGPGRLVGIDTVLTGGVYVSTAESMGTTEVYVIDLAEFNRLLETSAAFSRAVLREMAQDSQDLSTKIQGLVFQDIFQRLKYSLIGLARQHGHATAKGIRIDLDLTHEDIAALVAADRSTVTTNLKELTRQGYLWREGHHYVLLPFQHIEILDSLRQSIIEGDEDESAHWAQKAVDIRVDPVKALGILLGTMKQVDKGFVRGDLALSDVMLAVNATQCALPVIEQELKKSRKRMKTQGRVVIGTVQGDIHDLGKTIVSTLLTAVGFEVIDLGVDVNVGSFVKAVEAYRPQVLAMSAFLATTSSGPEQVIGALKERGLRDQVRIILGGGAITEDIAHQAGGDAYGRTAEKAVELVKSLVEAE